MTTKMQADFQNSQVLLNTLLNEKNDSTLITENKYHRVMVTHGSDVDDTESEIFDQCLIEDMKPKKLRTIQIPYDNNNFLKSQINEPRGMHRQEMMSDVHWEVDRYNRNYIKSNVNESLGLHRSVPQTERKWPIEHTNMNFIKSRFNQPEGLHRLVPEREDQWIVNQDNKNYVRTHVNSHKGMHRIVEEYKDQWTVEQDNRNFAKSYVNFHQGMHRNLPEPEQQWDVTHGNQNFIKSRVNYHIGMHRIMPDPPMQWEVDQNNMNYVKSYVNNHTGMHRNIPDMNFKWEVGLNNQAYARSYVNDHQGMHRYSSVPDGKWGVTNNNSKNFARSHINYPLGMHRIATMPKDEQWQVTHDNKNYIKSCVNQNKSMHMSAPDPKQQWKVSYDNKNFVKSVVNDPKGMHEKAIPSDEQWHVGYDNKNYIRSGINKHMGMHRNLPEQETLWKVAYGNKNFVKSHVNDHKGMYKKVPPLHGKWKVKGDNKNYIKSLINQHGGHHWKIPDVETQWTVDFDNKNYIRSYINEHHGMHKMSSELSVFLKNNKIGSKYAKSDTDLQQLYENCPETGDYLEVKYDKIVKIFKSDDDDAEQDVQWSSKDFRQSENERTCGNAFPQEDVPHQPELRRTSRGGFRYHGVVRNVYDYDPEDEEEWMKFATEHPEYQLRTKSRDYRKPGTTRAGYDTQDYMQVERNTDKPRDLINQTRNKQPRKWSRIAEQTTGTSRYEDDDEYYVDDAPQKQSIGPQVANALKYFNKKVSVPGSGVVPISRQYPIVSKTVQDNLRAYQKDTTPKSKPTIRGRSLRRSSGNTTNQQPAFSQNVEGHHNHDNDYGSTHHSQYEEVMNKGGRKMYVSSEETYSELHHKGRYWKWSRFSMGHR